QRLMHSLDKWKIPVSNMVVNHLVPPNPTCKFCATRRQMQQANLKDIRDLYSDLSLTVVPLFEGEIRGIENLEKLGAILLGEMEE
ncbi:MAG: arsenic-transporting ATPase, partial [Candidatus Thorarchaeota archaeon]|nr:arsenic-transporting ATPase [Candidatus Thorarchaeota archaeon]